MDKYKKIRRIGEGSFGIAYLAKVKGSDKCVVIKEVNLAKLSRPEQEEARKEVLVLSQLKHCNIVTYLDSYEAMSVLSLVMDYCDGGDLSEKIKTQKGSFFAEEQILNWFVQLCLAVKYIHDRNILHRDIKTQNLFLTRHGLLKLGDFGIAKVLGNTGDLARTCIGTPYYLSPEICRGHLYDSKSDIWSMGCVLYELSALKHAFEASSMQELISKILRVVYPEISSRYSFDLRSIIDSMLQKNPSFRPSCDMLLKNAILQNRLKNLLSDLGLDTNSRQTTAAIVRYSAPVQDKSIFISGVRCLDAQDLKVAKRPSTCNPNDVRTQVGGEPIVYSDKENVFSSCDNHNHNNNHNLRKPLVRGYIDSGKKDSFLRSAAAKKRITIKPRTPLKRVHTPVNVGFKKFVAQNESMLKDKRGHVPPSPYHRPVNLRLRPAHNPSTHHLRCPGAMPENEVCSGAIPRSNIYSDQPVKYLPLEIHKDVSCSNNKNYNNNNNCNNNSSKNKNSKNPRHHSNVPLLRLPQEPIWSDYEPSPARLRDEERKRQDKEYMERFKEIGLENLREKFNKKMEHLEAVNAINPITGTPRPPDCESRKRKMALIKAQVDARVERIRRELEARRQEEFARESLRISRETTGRVHDFEEASPYESPSVIPPGGKCSSSSSLSTSEQEDQKDRVDCGNVRNRREAEVELKAHNDDYANLKKKRLAILKMINDQLEMNNVASYDEKSSASCDLNSESNHKSKWNEIGHCTNLALLGLEESQIVSDGAQSDHQTRKRRHWSPMTETVILSLNSASISHSMESTDSKQSASELESTLKTSLEGSGFPEDYPRNHDMAKPNSLRDDVANDNHDDTGISDSLVKLADDEEKEIGQDNKKEGGGGDYPEKVQEQLANQVVNKPSIQNKGMGNEDLPHSPDDDDGKIEKFIRNLKTFASQNIDIRRTRRSSETELGKTILRRTEEFHDLKWKSRFSLDSIPNLIDHLQDLNPQHSQLKTSIRQEAFVDTIIDMRKCLRVELIEIIAIPGEHNNALCDSENNIEDDDDDRSSINIHRDDSAIKNGMTSAKDGEPSEVNPEEWIKKKRMEILEIISRSIEAKQAWSSMERNGNITGGDDDDYADDCVQKVKDCAEVVMAKEDECDSFILSSSFQSFHDDDDDDDDEEKDIDADGNIDDDSSREVDSDKDDDEDYEEQNDGEIIDGQLMPGNNIDNDNDDVSGDDDVNKDNCNSETVEEYSAISDDDLVEMEKVMRKSMASLLVTNPEDVTGDLMRKSMKMKKKKKKMKMRRVLGKPSVLTRMRRKRKTVVRVGSWSSTSIEDLQTMKSLLESYQDDDLN